MTSSSEQTTALIAELRRAADKKRADLALQSASLFTRAADALEAATKDLHEVGRLAGQIMFDRDAEPARAAILDVTRKYGNAYEAGRGY